VKYLEPGSDLKIDDEEGRAIARFRDQAAAEFFLDGWNMVRTRPVRIAFPEEMMTPPVPRGWIWLAESEVERFLPPPGWKAVVRDFLCGEPFVLFRDETVLEGLPPGMVAFRHLPVSSSAN
jgi:hypothetical protein